jgi:hypothetical protein
VKLGAENRNKLIASLALMGLAILLVGRMLFSSGPVPVNPEAAVSTVPAKTAAPRTRGRTLKDRKMAPQSIDPTLRTDWLKVSEDRKYDGVGRNIFLTQIEIPKPIYHAKLPPPPPPPPSGPPPPPPINLKFYGFASKPGEPKRVFLSQGEDVFIAGEGDIVDRRYKVLRITPTQVEIEDVLNNNRQNIPLTQG